MPEDLLTAAEETCDFLRALYRDGGGHTIPGLYDVYKRLSLACVVESVRRAPQGVPYVHFLEREDDAAGPRAASVPVCTVCGLHSVAAEDGFDTCEACLARQ
jgi:hypothetical protein